MKTNYLSIFIALLVVFSNYAYSQQVLSLEDAVNLAVERNPDLKAASLEIDKSKDQQVIARSAWLPAVYASAQVNHFFQLTPFFGFGETPSSGKVPYGRFGGEDQLNTYVSATQPLFNPQATPLVRQAGLKTEESRTRLEALKSETLYLVRQTYLQTLVLEERIALQRESVRRNERVLQDARVLFLRGKGLRVDTLRAFTAVKNLEPDLIKLSFARETSLINLKTLLGIDSLQDIKLADSLFVVDDRPIPSETEVYEAASNNNPTYKLYRLEQQLSEQQLNLTSAARLPSVSAVAQYQVQSQTRDLDYGNAYYPASSYVGLQVSVPLFTGLSNHTKVKQATKTKAQTDLRAAYALQQLRSAVHQAVANAEETRARLETTRSVEATAQLSYNITEYRYKRGVSSRLELADASLELSTAQSNFLEAVYDYLLARIALQKLMGNNE